MANVSATTNTSSATSQSPAIDIASIAFSSGSNNPGATDFASFLGSLTNSDSSQTNVKTTNTNVVNGNETNSNSTNERNKNTKNSSPVAVYVATPIIHHSPIKIAKTNGDSAHHHTDKTNNAGPSRSNNNASQADNDTATQNNNSSDNSQTASQMQQSAIDQIAKLSKAASNQSDNVDTSTTDVSLTISETTTIQSTTDLKSALEDFRSTLDELATLLKQADLQTGDTATTSQDFQSSLDSLMGKLEQDVTTISQLTSQDNEANNLLKILTGSDTTITDLTLLQTTSSDASNSAVSDALSNTQNTNIDFSDTLAEGLSSIKSELGKLKTLIAQSTSQPAVATSSPVIDTDPGVSLANNNGKASSEVKSAAAESNGSPAIVASAPVQPASVNNVHNNVDMISNAAYVTSSAASQDRSNDNNAGSGNNNQAGLTPTLAASLDKTASVPTDSNISFAGSLNKATANSVLQQVAYQVKNGLSDGSSKISIQLDPAELGKLEIKLHVHADGKTDVIITADVRSTLDLLKSDSKGLTQALSDAGLSADSNSLNFNLRGGQQQNGNGTQSAQTSFQRSDPSPVVEEDNTSAITTRSYVVNVTDGLDIQI